MAQGKWKDAWSSAKDEFKDLTKEKKPDSAKLLGLVSKHKSGVAKALGTVDAAWLAYTTAVTQFGNGKQPEAKVYDALNVYGRAVKAGQKAIADYSGTLDAEIGKLKSKDDKELRYKGLKAMARTLAASL